MDEVLEGPLPFDAEMLEKLNITLRINWLKLTASQIGFKLNAFSATYIILMIVGLVGNGMILLNIVRLDRWKRRQMSSTLTYLTALCCIDLLSTLSLAPVVLTKIVDPWLLGEAACRVHMFAETAGRVLNSFVLTAMSFDRCASVAWPHHVGLRHQQTARRLLAVTLTLGVLFIVPTITHSNVVRKTLLEVAVMPQSLLVALSDNTPLPANSSIDIRKVYIDRCKLNIAGTPLLIFSTNLFIFAFLLPFVLTGYFSWQLMISMRQKQNRIRILLQRPQLDAHRSEGRRTRGAVGGRNRRSRVGLQSVLLCAFYYVCFLPYWLITIFSTYLEVFFGMAVMWKSPWYQHAMEAVHTLPFINSSSNWIFYGAMNRQIGFLASASTRRTRANANNTGSAGGDSLVTTRQVPKSHISNQLQVLLHPSGECSSSAIPSGRQSAVSSSGTRHPSSCTTNGRLFAKSSAPILYRNLKKNRSSNLFKSLEEKINNDCDNRIDTCIRAASYSANIATDDCYFDPERDVVL